MDSTTPTVRRQAMHDAAIVRRQLGQAALHQRLQDGRHQVMLAGRVVTGDTLDAAIQAAKGGPTDAR